MACRRCHERYRLPLPPLCATLSRLACTSLLLRARSLFDAPNRSPWTLPMVAPRRTRQRRTRSRPSSRALPCSRYSPWKIRCTPPSEANALRPGKVPLVSHRALTRCSHLCLKPPLSRARGSLKKGAKADGPTADGPEVVGLVLSTGGDTDKGKQVGEILFQPAPLFKFDVQVLTYMGTHMGT